MKERLKHRPIILFLGPQGGGKGTQAELLAKRLKIPAISTGALYREEIENKTRLGRLVEDSVKNGVLVADEITNSLLAWRMRETDVENGIILDGYPRTLGQVAALELIGTPTLVIAVNVSDVVAVKRISGRRICSYCNMHYHMEFRSTKQHGICDRCGHKLVQRADDTPTAVKKRLTVYHKNTEPILAIYDRLGKLVEFDGARPVDEIAKDVWHAVQKSLPKK